jgi:hypothetical protein
MWRKWSNQERVRPAEFFECGLIAVAIITVVTLLGAGVSNPFNTIANDL